MRILAAALIIMCCSSSFAEEYTVKRVVDVRTIQLEEDDLVVVLAGIKAAPTEQGQSVSYTENMLYRRKVWVEFDIVREDERGYMLAYVFAPLCLWDENSQPCNMTPPEYYHAVEVQGGITSFGIYNFINATLVKSGYAIPDESSPNSKHEDLFKKLLRNAKAKKRGVWEYYREPAANCPTDTKICPDGSFAVRVGPRCKFEACP